MEIEFQGLMHLSAGELEKLMNGSWKIIRIQYLSHFSIQFDTMLHSTHAIHQCYF